MTRPVPYQLPQMVSAHTNLGLPYDTSRCRQTSTPGRSVRNQVINGSMVNKAFWECDDQECDEGMATNLTLFLLAFHYGAIDLVCTRHRGEGGLLKCVPST